MKILICDDSYLIREGVRGILKKHSPNDTLSEAETAIQAKDLLRANDYDLVILDISLSGKDGSLINDDDGIELLKDIKISYPSLPVLMLSVHTEKTMVLRAFKNGARGYLHKNFIYEELLKAISAVSSGCRYIAESLREMLTDEIGQISEESPHQNLSDLHLRIVCKIAAGKTTDQIAEETKKDPSTIRSHKAKILEVMGMKTMDQVIHSFKLRKLL